MNEIQAVRLDALHLQLACPCGMRCVVGADLDRSTDVLNEFLLGHREHHRMTLPA